MGAPCNAKKCYSFLNMMLFAMLSFMFTGFCVYFLHAKLHVYVQLC